MNLSLATEMAELEAAMVDPERAGDRGAIGDMDAFVARYGELQGRFEELDGYALEARVREVLAGLGFSQECMDGDVGLLSCGRKMRVALSRIPLMWPDGMLLDEPSNHLDMATKEMLVAALAEFEGTMLFVSYDRHFLAGLSNRVLELTPDGVHRYGGGYTEYVAPTGREAPGLHPGS